MMITMHVTTPLQTRVLLGWEPFTEIDLDFQRFDLDGSGRIDHLGGSFQTSEQASTFLLDSVTAGWILTNITVWE